MFRSRLRLWGLSFIWQFRLSNTEKTDKFSSLGSKLHLTRLLKSTTNIESEQPMDRSMFYCNTYPKRWTIRRRLKRGILDEKCATCAIISLLDATMSQLRKHVWSKYAYGNHVWLSSANFNLCAKFNYAQCANFAAQSKISRTGLNLRKKMTRKF